MTKNRHLKRPIIIGTRGSLLAMAQATDVRRRLKKKYPRVSFELSVVKTLGDEYQGVALFRKKGIGVFTRAIERKLKSRAIDIAVHSLKDLPTESPRGLCLAAFPKRLRTQDVLLSRKRYSLDTLPKGAVVGTGSPRRKRQIQRLRPDLVLKDIRGNLNTRVRKVITLKTYDAIVVAAAGLKRVRRYQAFAKEIPREQCLPAAGQGALGLQVRLRDRRLRRMVRSLNDLSTERVVSCEREVLRLLRGGCRVPAGILAEIRQGKLRVKAALFSVKTSRFLTGEAEGPASQFKTVARRLAGELARRGAERLVREARDDG